MREQPTAHEALAEQLRSDIGAVAWGLTALLGPDEATRVLDAKISARAPMWASQLLADDDKLAAQTVIDLMNVLWPTNTEPPPEWWSSPLGQAAARSIGHHGAETVSYSVAGAMLGCSKQYVSKLVAGGKLERGTEGGVTTSSVRALLRARTAAAIAK